MSLETLKTRLAERLEPVDGWRPDLTAHRSDFDLNPKAARTVKDLRPAAVLIPVIARPEGATVLLTRRADTLARHTGQIAFPGGRLDPGETAVQAALREADEEVALEPKAVEVLGLSDAYETGTGFLVTPVNGWLAIVCPLRVPRADSSAPSKAMRTPSRMRQAGATAGRPGCARAGVPRGWRCGCR